MVPGIDLRVLHLVRDPRAAAYSWAKKKPQPDSADREFMHRKTPTQSAVLWDAWNAAIEALWRRTPEKYLRLRYEDFIADPRASFEAMLRLVGEEGAELPLVGEREVKLGISHTGLGKPQPIRHRRRRAQAGPSLDEQDEPPRPEARHRPDSAAPGALPLPAGVDGSLRTSRASSRAVTFSRW
jgi:hypothetical protein